jgi:O-antigen ligase
LILDGARTALPRDLAPGETATVSAQVQAPALTGTVVLQWDVVQETVAWFSTRGSTTAEVNVQVTPARQHLVAALVPVHGLLSNSSSPPRAALWRAGVQMWLSHPLLGSGPDNFRHTYGHYLGLAAFDDRITANSWYVELLATTGLMGLISWLLIPAALIFSAQQNRRMLPRRARVLLIGLSAALLAFLLHGVVDYFMEFTPTYGLFWLIAGLFVGLLTGTRDAEVMGLSDRV